MKKLIIALSAIFILTSCQRGCQKMEKGFQTTERNYEVIMYSGGDTVFVDRFRGIINSEEGSDGIYYYKADTLVEVSGDYIIKSVK